MSIDYKKQIGQNLRQLRISRGLKQNELAEKVNVEDKTISRIEVGGNYPSFSLLVKIAEVLDYPLVDFVAEAEQNIVTKTFQHLNNKEINTIKKFIEILHSNL